jgi:hypothetical protein
MLRLGIKWQYQSEDGKNSNKKSLNHGGSIIESEQRLGVFNTGVKRRDKCHRMIFGKEAPTLKSSNAGCGASA